MRKHILSSSIIPPSIQFSMMPDDGGGEGGGAGAGEGGEKPKPEEAGLGSAFKGFLTSMKEEAPDSTKGGDPTTADANAKPKDEASAAAEADAAKKKEAPKKKARDPMLDVLGEKKPDEKKPDVPPVDAAKAKEAREAEIAAATKGMSAPAAANFKKLAAERDAAEKKAADIAAEFEKVKAAKPELPSEVKQQLADLEALRAEHAKAMDMLEKIGAERSPAYQTKYVKGRATLIEKATTLVKNLGGDSAAFAAAMELKGKDRSAAMANAMEQMESFDVQRVAAIVTELESLDEEGSKFLGNARESLQAEEQRAQQQEHERRQQLASAQDQTFTAVANGMLSKLPDDHPDAAEVNGLVDKVIAEAKEFLFKSDKFEDFSTAAIAKAMFPVMKQKLSEAAQTIMKLEQQIEDLTNADPDLGSGGGGAGSGGAPQEKSFVERFKGAGQTAGVGA